jgi:hypothetical protein
MGRNIKGSYELFYDTATIQNHTKDNADELSLYMSYFNTQCNMDI